MDDQSQSHHVLLVEDNRLARRTTSGSRAPKVRVHHPFLRTDGRSAGMLEWATRNEQRPRGTTDPATAAD
jgi:hypothetical protein